MNQPLKRAPELIPLSRDHHHALLLCWKIRQGIAKKVDPNRIMQYIRWFYDFHLEPHFELEEKKIFTLPGVGSALVEQAIGEHAQLRFLINQTPSTELLSSFEKTLEQHVRFEERVLFVDVQKNTSTELLHKLHIEDTSHQFKDNLTDAFWMEST
ncbi:MAG: hemerythrin domain-containing protein [Crocinitomicaceae bacterium]|nr:hemerythrin domain-containing protein [Crocinitomicaceae bacterium]MBK8924634.1 hemerythrin domain-containing protein [Crocinitomicaceae bacterium]